MSKQKKIADGLEKLQWDFNKIANCFWMPAQVEVLGLQELANLRRELQAASDKIRDLQVLVAIETGKMKVGDISDFFDSSEDLTLRSMPLTPRKPRLDNDIPF